MEFETYSYTTRVGIADRTVTRLWILRKNTQDEFIVKEVYEDNCYKLPDDLSGKVIIDVGANIGAFAAACVDRGSKAVYCYDPFIMPATKLFPACTVLEPYAVGNRKTGKVRMSSLERGEDGTYFTGGYNSFSPSDRLDRVSISIESIISDIGITFPGIPIWIKLDCEGSEYEILASDLPWNRIERIFGECHTLIDGKLSRDTAPIENGRFPIEPNILSLAGRLESVGYKVKIEANGDDRHLHLFWAFNGQMLYSAVDQMYRNSVKEQSISKAVEYAERLEALGIFTNSPSMLTEMGSVEKIVDRSPANEHDTERLQMLREEDTGQPDRPAEVVSHGVSLVGELGELESALEPSTGQTPRQVAVLTPFRNARRYLPLYFRQLTSLRDLLSQNNYSLRLVAAEGDSLDGTHDRIIELANEHNIPLTMVDTTHGGMKWGSVEDPVRMKVMSDVMNKALDQVKESDSIVVWIMSDLEWNASTLLDMILSLESSLFHMFAPIVLLNRRENGFGTFYDTWAFRRDGKRFTSVYPYHPDFPIVIKGESVLPFIELESAGTCLVMQSFVARNHRASNMEAVSFCQSARENGGWRIGLHSRSEIYHAPKLSYSILWISDAVCISGFSRVAHSLFPLLSEAGFDLEIIAQNYYGTPHNFPYTIWPANVNGEDPSGTLRMQNLLWANRNNKDKYDAIVVLDDPWNVPRVVKGIEHVSRLIRQEGGDTSFTPPPVISWVTVDGKNVKFEDLDGTNPIMVTDFGRDRYTSLVVGSVYSPVVPFGVDSSIFQPLDKLECRKLTCGDGSTVPYDSFIVGTVSNNQLRKNLHLVIESFSEWVHRYGRSDTYLYLCLGKESETGCNVESLVRYYDLRNRVVVNRSALPDEILAKVYNSFDVFISLSTGEGFGLTALEAMACGVPCVLTDWSGYSSWVPNDTAIKIPCSHTQLTAPLNSQSYVIGGVVDKGKVVAALQKLWTFTEMREKLSIRGREVARDLSWKNAADKLVNVLERVIERESIKRESKHICSPENGCGFCE